VGDQLSFALPLHVSLGADDFYVSEANARAFAMITDATDWPERKLALVGPQGSGKSHLARIWQRCSGAVIHQAAALDGSQTITAPAVVIEDMQQLPVAAQEQVFHLHNQLAATGGHLLLTADRAPSRWDITLPDLASRMQATSVIQITDPDDRLLVAVLTKLFADRQLAPPPEAITWLAQRIERSFLAAAQTVALLDRAALDQGRDLTSAFMRQVLDKDDQATR